MDSGDTHPPDTSAELLRQQLRSEPYTTLRVWQDGLAIASPAYLNMLDTATLTSIKASLDHTLQSSTESTLGTHYHDDFFPREAVNVQVHVLALKLFRQATGQLLTAPETPNARAVLARTQALLSDDADNELNGVEPVQLSEAIRGFLHLQARHMQHFRYSWSDIKADPTLFQSFVRETLQ